MSIAVSIIVPVFNTAKYLGECLDSLTNQSCKDIEIICINDCSQDASLHILRSYAAEDARITIIDNAEKMGPGPSRNRGIEEATGQYLMFVDSDDFIAGKTVELLLKKMEESVDVIVFNGKMFSANGIWDFFDHEKVSRVPWHYKTFYPTEHAGILHFTNAATAMIRRSFLNDKKIRFSPMYFEDWEFMWHLFSLNPAVRFVNEPFYWYRRNITGSITHQIDNQKTADLFIAYEKGVQHFIDSNVWDKFEYHVYFIAIGYFYDLIPYNSIAHTHDYLTKFKNIMNKAHPLMLRSIMANNSLKVHNLFCSLILKNPYIAMPLLLRTKLKKEITNIQILVRAKAVRLGIETELSRMYSLSVVKIVRVFLNAVIETLFMVPFLVLKLLYKVLKLLYKVLSSTQK